MQRKSDNPRLVSFTRLPNRIQQTGIAWIEFQQKHGIVTDPVQIPEGAWSMARWRFNGLPGSLSPLGNLSCSVIFARSTRPLAGGAWAQVCLALV